MRYRFAMIYNRQRLVERINASAAANLSADFRSIPAGAARRRALDQWLQARPALGDYDFLADCVAFACACRLIINHNLLHGLSRILCGVCC